ncbi:MAG TPA: hypothetical protein VIC58_08545 [Actinomycetota bacterium]
MATAFDEAAVAAISERAGRARFEEVEVFFASRFAAFDVDDGSAARREGDVVTGES